MKDDKRLKRKVRNSYIVSMISMALVLFLLGSVGYLMMAAERVASSLRNSIVVMVELRGDHTLEQRAAIEELIKSDPLTASLSFVSREEKASDEEFRKVLDENPLLDSFEVTLTAGSENRDEVDRFLTTVEQIDGVDRATFPALMAEQLHRTVGKIRFVMILFGGALLLISLILLNNTIRLAIFSKRYLINTMKLVGATKWFIMKPFLSSAISQGLLSGLLAAVLFAAAVYGLSEAVPELTTLADWQWVGIMLATLVGVGVLLSLLFTAVAINKFVNMKSNKIYLY